MGRLLGAVTAQGSKWVVLELGDGSEENRWGGWETWQDMEMSWGQGQRLWPAQLRSQELQGEPRSRLVEE